MVVRHAALLENPAFAELRDFVQANAPNRARRGVFAAVTRFKKEVDLSATMTLPALCKSDERNVFFF
jgi:tRNA G37 N-methylase TrmD